MTENIDYLKIKYIDNTTEEIENSDGEKTVNVDLCSRAIFINQYKKKGSTGQIISRIILFEQVRELEVVRT